MQPESNIRRREFLAATAATAAAGSVELTAAGREVAIVTDPADTIASSAPVKWAATRLETALSAKGVTVRRANSVANAGNASASVLIAGTQSKLGQTAQQSARATVENVPEALGLLPATLDKHRVAAVVGHDP